MEYRIELRDRDFNLLQVIENEAINLIWEYNRIGGCGSFSFILPRDFDNQGNLGGFYDVRIYKRTGKSAFELWYSGYIEDKTPTKFEPDTIQINGWGYSAQLQAVVVNTTYTNMEVSDIVTNILDTYIVPNTDILYSAGDIEDTGFTADSFKFNTTADQVMQTLAETVGAREWGIDEDRNFFFKARSETITFYYTVGDGVLRYQNIDSFRSILNRIYIEGGEVAGTKYTRTVNDSLSQLKFGLREGIISNSAIITDTVADQYGASILSEKADVARRARIEIEAEETRTEATIPIGLVVPRTRGYRYGEKKYGEGVYSADVSYQVNKITYSIDENKGITKVIDLGQLRPQLAEELEKLSYQLEQLRAARV